MSTVVVAELTDSVRFGPDLHPESRQMLTDYTSLRVADVVRALGGSMAWSIGPCSVSVFDHEDGNHAEEVLVAIRAAQEIRNTVGGLKSEIIAQTRARIGWRIGVETGDITRSRTGRTGGAAVDRALELQQATEHDEVLVGPVAASLVDDRIRWPEPRKIATGDDGDGRYGYALAADAI
jgi:class 3 adenylate cyclase